MSELPYIDEHAILIVASPEVVWRELEQYVAAFLRRTEDGLLTRVLGAEPRAGFEIAERVPPGRLTLAGRHRFARYQLAFDLTEAANGATHLRATTHAQFPGLRGRAYRALVIGTRAHVVATTRILRSIRRRALRRLVGVPLAVCALLGLDAHSASAQVPAWIAPEPSGPPGHPLWVSVEAALTTDGSLRSELFSPELVAATDLLNEQAKNRQHQAEAEGYEIAAECAALVPYDCDQHGPPRGRNPAELYTNSAFVLAGKVTGSRQGSFRQTAGRLLEVVVEETVKAPSGTGPHRSLLLGR